MKYHRTAAARVVALLVVMSCAATVGAAPLVVETFDVDPIASGRAQVVGSASRFTSQPGGLTAHYDTALATSELLWPLGRTLDQNTSFTIEAAFTIRSANFFAKVNDFAQISLGLLNSKTTGTSRTGGNAYDFVGLDYFPSSATVPSWNVPALGPVVIQSHNGTSYFGRIAFPFGAESGLKHEGPLPLETQLFAQLSYDASLRTLTLAMSTANGPLDVNSTGDLGDFGGYDGDISTIELDLPLDVSFAVDRLALPLWNVPAVGGSGSVVIADVLFDSLRVDLPALIPGDANGDGRVDGADYTIWADHFLLTNQSIATGDFTGDGRVDGADYTVWADHYNPGKALATAASELPSASSVPEPSALWLAALGAGLALPLATRRIPHSRPGKTRGGRRQRSTRGPLGGRSA
ncbi:MAG: dockerin type I repeat-containing protein [Planctomycetaceae bacterium]|nr:dockerin type I repeat-containing protein [Planctomycetaceae bacterium]